MTNSRLKPWTGFILVLGLAVGGWQAQATPTPTPVASSSPDVSPSPTPVLPDFNPTPTPYGLTDIAATIESGRNQLQDIETNLNQPSPAPDIVAGLDTLLQVVAQDMPAVRLKLAQTPSGNELRDLENQWKVLATPLLDWKKRLSTRASELDDAGKSLRELKATWLAAKEVDLPVELLDGIEKLVGRMKAAEDRIRSDRDRLLVMLDRLNFVDAQIKSTLTEIANARQTQVKQVFLQDSPPLWNVNFREWPRGELVGQTLKKQLDDLTDYFKAHLERFLFHLLCFGLLVLGVGRADNRIRPWVQLEPLLERPARVFRTPFTTGMLLAYLLTPWVYPQPPIMLRAMLGATALFPAALVLSRLLDRYYHSVLKLILALFLVDQLRELIDPKVLLARLLLTGELTFIVVFLVTRFLTAPKDNIGGLPAAFLRTVAAALYGSAWILTVCGFVNLGGLLGQSTLSATYLGIMLLAMVQVLNGLILLSLRTPPLSLLASVRDFRPLYRDRLQRLVVLLARGIWLISLLEFLNLRQPMFDFVSTVLNASINVGQIPISLGKLVAFILALIIPYQMSRFLRFQLEQDIYPRMSVSVGQTYTVSMLIHYLLLAAGVLVALAAIGVDSTKVTIVAGALSVGIGFGLQNIVNNFVSGLILLFERPIEVGHVIEVAGELGTLKKIGLRASVLRTPDGSDIIVPNGELLSTKVTNWTLSDQRRLVRVDVSVAYGTSIHQALSMLLEIASQHPELCQEPPPEVVLMALAESGLNLQLRVWTYDANRWVVIRGHLLVSAYEAFNQAGIKIPFPQLELHRGKPESGLPESDL